MGHKKRLGIFFLFIALLLLLNNLGLVSGHTFLLNLGLGFIAIYLLLGGRKKYGNIGLLIPGTILVSIWLSITFAEQLDLGPIDGAHFLFFIGLAFLTVFMVHTFSFKEESHGDRYWPLYPAIGLILLGSIIYLSQVWEWKYPITFNRILNYLWILVFLGIGLKLILSGKKKTDNKGEDT